VVAEIKDQGGLARLAECDISREDAVSSAVEAARAFIGRLDFGVNCAGIYGPGPAIRAADMDAELLDEIVRVNVRGTFLTMKHELRVMLPQGSGSIVNISSGAGLVGLRGASAYAATKHAIIGMTKSAALDYAEDRIRVNAVCPGSVETGLNANGRTPEMREATRLAHPMARTGTAAEIADAVVWLCSSRSSFVTGIALPVDGGYIAR
jgi:NAD(P)-dependent dehydrogenase (short-subunit alcohol dehydrogenase family)